MKKPTISILLPVRNEEKYISPCLDQILRQEGLEDNIEIIVADGMSTDRTCEIIRSYQAKYPNIILIDNPGKIVSTGLNLAIQRSSGEIIIRIDGHTTIAPDYVSECVAAINRSGADNVGGPMHTYEQTPFCQAVAIATSTPFGVGGARFHYSEKEEWVDTVYMGAWPRRVFERIGLFDEELVRDQDDEFNYRLRKYGGRILLSPRIRSQYTVRSTPQGLWKQYYQYGFYKVRVLQKHPRQMYLRQFVPPAFVASLAGFALLAVLFRIVWIPFILVGGGYLLANLIVSIYTAHKSGWKFLPLLMVCFAILHLSYGFGFLAGLIHFMKRWGDKNGKLPDIVIRKGNSGSGAKIIG
jgi:succinoglycan biosynthesis protein ExoA